MAFVDFRSVLESFGLAPARRHVRQTPRVEPVLPPADPPDTLDPAPFADIDLSELIGQRVGLLYRDVDGDESRREVTVKTLRRTAGGEGIALQCWCHMRGAPRKFRLDRVAALFDVETGEAFDDAQAFLRALAEAGAPASTPAEKAAAAIAGVKAELNVLVFLARADGWHDSEVPVAVNFALDGPASPRDIDVTELERRIRAMDPDERAFSGALTFLSRDGTDATRRLARAIRRMIDADGVISDDEAQFAEQLGKFIR
jgi:hypothetical protein